MLSVEGRAEVYRRIRESGASVQRDPGTSFRSLFGRDQDNTVGRTGTLKGGGGGILDNRDILDIRGIDRTHDVGLGIVHVGGLRSASGT